MIGREKWQCWCCAGKHAAEILAMSLEGFGDSRRMLATLAKAVASPPASAAGASSQAEDYQALEKMAAQNVVAIKVRVPVLQHHTYQGARHLQPRVLV